MRHHERGVTFLGWLFILIPMALLLYAGIRLAPVYLEYMKIARTLEQVRDELRGQQADAPMLRTAIEKRFDIESVTIFTVRDTDKLQIRREDPGYIVQAVYSHAVPYIGNIFLRVDFDKVVTIE